MSVDAGHPSELCETCGAPVDVSELEPLATVECPVCGAPFVALKMLGPYELLEAMGRGGMGVVYRAFDHQLDRQVALKVLRDEFSQDAEFTEKLDEEAAITGGIRHPYVVKVFTTGTERGRFYIAMELVSRGTLDDLLNRQGRVAEIQALQIASQIAQGLRAANNLGLIHRDVKPGNILFANDYSAKIVDFGLAMLEEASRGSDEIWGTPYYVSPERLDHKPEDFRSDIYSLGATIFHAIAGRPPFEAEDATRVALKHLQSKAVSLQAFAPWVAGSTAFVINRMLHKDPKGRYQSYDELIEHLEYARTQVTIKGTQKITQSRVVLETDEDRKRWGQVTVGIILLFLLVSGSIGAYLTWWSPPRNITETEAALVESIGADGRHAVAFEAARKLLLANKAVAGAEAFHTLSLEKGLPQPLLQWCIVQEALGYLLAGDLRHARVVMVRLRDLPFKAPGKNLASQKLFFERIAMIVLQIDATKTSELSEFDPVPYGSLAYLISGLKNLASDDLEAANSALRRFQSTSPKGSFSWIREYEPLVDDYLADLSTFRGATLVRTNAKTPGELRDAAATLQEAKNSLRRKDSTLATKLEQAAQDALRQAANPNP